jgi:acetyltransferase-like isoleucine patch superfamily enzyme
VVEKEQSVVHKPAERITANRSIERITPSCVKATVKKVYWRLRRLYARYRHIEKGRFVEFGYRFRFTREGPYRAYVGERTVVEDFNVWSARQGDIVVGKHCWFGLYDIVMGPVEIGDDTETGPGVKILGPHHPVFDLDFRKEQKTIIGKNVRILAGAIILFGIRIGDNAVISAGSVVNKDVPDGAFVAGNPARNLSGITHRAWEMADTKDKAGGDKGTHE